MTLQRNAKGIGAHIRLRELLRERLEGIAEQLRDAGGLGRDALLRLGERATKLQPLLRECRQQAVAAATELRRQALALCRQLLLDARERRLLCLVATATATGNHP